MTDMPETIEKKEKNSRVYLFLTLILLLLLLGLAGGGWLYFRTLTDTKERNLATTLVEQRLQALEREIANLNQSLNQAQDAYQKQLEELKGQVSVPTNLALLCADINLSLAEQAFSKGAMDQALVLTKVASSCLLQNLPALESLQTTLASATPPPWEDIVNDLWALNDDVALLDAPKKISKPEVVGENGWKRFWGNFKTEMAKLFVVEEDGLLEARARLQLLLSSASVFAKTHDAEKTLALLEAGDRLVMERFDQNDEKVKAFLTKSERLKNSLGSFAIDAFEQARLAVQARLGGMDQ
jgi:uncharacterized protein HemX